MAEHDDRKNAPKPESSRGPDARTAGEANVGRRERPIVGEGERRIHRETRSSVELEAEAAQRASAPSDAHPPTERASDADLDAAEDVPASGWARREDLSNPTARPSKQTGERQSQELPGQGFRASRASSQNAARIADFEEAPARPSR